MFSMTNVAISSQMLSAMTECAYRLGMAFGDEAERAEAHAQRLEYFTLFDRCFFSVRVAMGLELRLRRDQPALRVAPDREALRERADPSDARMDRDCDVRERERDREVEPASIPLFLKTLRSVAADAAALPGPPPGALPGLRELLARIASAPAPTVTPAKPAVGLRARLSGSATASILTLSPPIEPKRPAFGLPLRHATGPPRR